MVRELTFCTDGVRTLVGITHKYSPQEIHNFYEGKLLVSSPDGGQVCNLNLYMLIACHAHLQFGMGK